MDFDSDPLLQNELASETEGAEEEETIVNSEEKPTITPKSKSKRSTVWNYFDKTDDKTVVCRICRKSFKFCGNTTNLNSHIQRIHPNVTPPTSVDHNYEVPIRKRTSKKRNYSDVISEAVSHYTITTGSENNTPIQLLYNDSAVSGLERVEQSVRSPRPLVTKLAPTWECTAVVDGEFVTLKSSDFRGKYIILLFYPLAFAYESPTEILRFNERLTDFKILDTEVLACSIDSHFTLLAWNKTSSKTGGLGNVDIPLLSDIHHKISKNYGVFVDDLGHSLKATFIIDPKGILRHMTVSDLSEGCNVNEVLRLIQTFYNTDTRDLSTYKC